MGSKEMSANYERERAIMEGERNVAADRYFDARPQLDTLENGSIYDAGFTDAYRTQTAKIEELEKDAVRYQWLCDKGHSYHGAMAGTGSMSICRGPYILLEPPSHNKFSNMILTKQAADVIIDKAISEGLKK
jgi:hypothetical protein